MILDTRDLSDVGDAIMGFFVAGIRYQTASPITVASTLAPATLLPTIVAADDPIWIWSNA
jgi:hypothetical protein